MMRDDSPCRHIDTAACLNVSEKRPCSDRSDRSFHLVHDSEQELTTTASRQLRSADEFLAAAEFMVGSGYHPRSGTTTMRLARLFAARMNRSKDGTFPFAVDATAHELGLSRRTVLVHARCLRELGLLAYAVHGSKTNVLRTRKGAAWQQGDGYAGTATIFAAVAPAAWDRAMGRRIDGTGYRARPIGVTDHGRSLAVGAARRKASRRSDTCTPSSVVPTDHSQQKVERGNNNTHERARRRSNSTTRSDISTVTAAEAARGIGIAEQLRHEVWWLHRSCARQLAYVLRPLITAGWTYEALAAELRTWGVPCHLRSATAYMHHELTRRQRTGALPQSAPAIPDHRVDENGYRYAEHLRLRRDVSAPTWRRYATKLRPELRRRIAQAKSSPSLPLPGFAYRLMCENEDGVRRIPRAGRRVNPESFDYWRDQFEAERAFAALRLTLDARADHRA